MKIVWDEPKRRANLAKHGLDFEDVAFFEWENARISPARGSRQKAVGLFEGRTAVVIFSLLGSEAISIVSFRLANRRER